MSRQPDQLPSPLAELAAQRLRILGQAMRIRLIGELECGERTIQEIAEGLATTQQNVSQHLGILHSAGILSREKNGSRVTYRLVDPHIAAIFDLALESLAHHSDQLAQLTHRSD